jgi:hypothetical protein
VFTVVLTVFINTRPKPHTLFLLRSMLRKALLAARFFPRD